ncbi:MAG: hypothetical protein WKF60_02910 [Ilumatobacter sp.]
MDPAILASARKHRISDDDMLHAYRHPIRVFDLDDLTMLIGVDTAARFLEIGVAESDGIEFIGSRHARPRQVPGDLMPRSIQDILDHADQLAERLENYEPTPGDERPVEEYLLERAALARARSERQIVDAVTAARAKGVPWQRIGELLGTSAQAAQQRYGNVVTAS